LGEFLICFLEHERAAAVSLHMKHRNIRFFSQLKKYVSYTANRLPGVGCSAYAGGDDSVAAVDAGALTVGNHSQRHKHHRGARATS
jgi:hypothetical protein